MNQQHLNLADFDYDLPSELIAQSPAERRDSARLLVLSPKTTDLAPISHRVFSDLTTLLPADSLIVTNDTRVIPARLLGHKSSGGAVELLLISPLTPSTSAPPQARWSAMYRATKPLKAGAQLIFTRAESRGADPLCAVVIERLAEGRVAVEFAASESEFLALLERFGALPLPPYIQRGELGPSADDRDRYQTVFAREPGAIAAPTAGLHFTPPLLAALRERGIEHTTLTLHVGPGTFAPIRDDNIAAHVMHSERYDVSAAAAQKIADARRDQRHIVAVGTTVVRTLESAYDEATRAPKAGSGATALFIQPGYRFRAFDSLITNFHVPKSTLMLLVSAFAGRENILRAYREAISQRYRLFSYGDAMWIQNALHDGAALDAPERAR